VGKQKANNIDKKKWDEHKHKGFGGRKKDGWMIKTCIWNRK
jgi:hypothetical protein